MDATEIKIALLKKGITQRTLLKRWGVSKAALSHLVNGTMRSARLERNLARVLGVTVEQLTGIPNGKRRKRRGKTARS